jgi:hypothetical protein
MIALLPLLAAAAAPIADNSSDKIMQVPVAEFSAPALDFACLTEPQPDGRTANWVLLGLDYRNGSGVLDFNARFPDKRDFAVLKDSVQNVQAEKLPDGMRWQIKVSGDFEGTPVTVDATIVRHGTRLLADYIIKKGSHEYVGTECLQVPLPRTVHGYDELVKSYRAERGQ